MDKSTNSKDKDVVRILLAEDEQEIRRVISRIISQLGYDYHGVSNGQQAIDAIAEDAYDIVITDMRMPVLGGMALLEHVKRFYPSVDVMVVTGFDADYSFTEVIGKGASDFLAKPFSPDELSAKINRIVRERKLIREYRIEINSHLNARKEIERNYRTMEVVNNLLCLSIEDYSVEEILKNFILQLTNLPWLELEPKGAAFLVERDQSGQPSLAMQAHHGLPDALLVSCSRVPFGRCLCGRAAVSREVVFASNVDDRHDISYTGMEPHGHYCIPILTKEGELMGVFTLYTRDGAVRNAKSIRVLTSAASMIAGVLRRKQAEEQLLLIKEQPPSTNQ